MLDNKKYSVVSYEISGPDFGGFDTLEDAKNWADNLKYKLLEDYSVIFWDENGDGVEVYTTKNN